METSLHVDELQTLVTFLNDSLRETSADQLVKRALTLVRHQTGADVSGFLGLDPEDPLPRLLLPAQGELDGNLSKKLTNLMKRTNQSVWMAKDEHKTSNSDSLAGFTDALCIPIRSAEAKNPEETALGALHAYKHYGIFTERQVQFCEALAGSLANGLRSLRTRRVLEADNSRLRFRSPGQSDRLIGGSKQMERLRSDIARLADCPCTVLIIGESGVGKELVAEDLHHQSSRREGPLVPVNCGAIAASMAESELFGHEMGAFTNAIRTRPGYFRDADEGTLFLDEIGELSTECQAMMLRVLESRRVRPVGSDREIAVDVRLVAATNRDLPKESREGRFRVDLFYRLGTVITVPPLRDHLEDIPELARHFLRGFAALYKRHTQLSESALKRLMSYTWPGNVRQLRTVLETAVAMTSEEVITEADLRITPDLPAAKQLPSLNLEELETMAIRQALEQTRMNNTHAARLLGIHRETLINKLKKIDG
jgi:DNA-binding NtrC family response regulator